MTGQVTTTNQNGILDSGASRYMTAGKNVLKDYHEFSVPESVILGDGRTLKAYGCGQVKITVSNRDKNKICLMTGVLYVPKLACNLFSVRSVTQKGMIVQFGYNRCLIKNSSGKVLATGDLTDRMYQMNFETFLHDAFVANDRSEDLSKQINIWHQRLGHVNQVQLIQTVEKAI